MPTVPADRFRRRFPYPILACLALAAGAGQALAQVGQYRLDEHGNWVALEAPALSPDEQLMLDVREMLAEERYTEAKRLLDEWIERQKHSQHPLLARAYLLRGDAISLGGDEFQALYDYETVVKDFVGSEEYPRAVERELQIAIRYVHGLKRKLWTMRIVDAEDVGEELLVRVQERMPGSALAEKAAIELADYYYRIRDLRMASQAYEVFLANFPRSPHATWARQRRIHANIARFKGPAYDATGLRDAKILIEDYAAMDPAGAQRAGFSDALAARLDESMAAQMLTKARWYLRRGDSVSGRYVLQRLVVKHPQTVAAGAALDELHLRGWQVQALEPGADPVPALEVRP
jgi:tetratricopeptide (TPR) repeat protein